MRNLARVFLWLLLLVPINAEEKSQHVSSRPFLYPAFSIRMWNPTFFWDPWWKWEIGGGLTAGLAFFDSEVSNSRGGQIGELKIGVTYDYIVLSGLNKINPHFIFQFAPVENSNASPELGLAFPAILRKDQIVHGFAPMVGINGPFGGSVFLKADIFFSDPAYNDFSIGVLLYLNQAFLSAFTGGKWAQDLPASQEISP